MKKEGNYSKIPREEALRVRMMKLKEQRKREKEREYFDGWF